MVCQLALEVAQTIFIPIGWRARVQGQADTTDTTAMVALGGGGGGGGCCTQVHIHPSEAVCLGPKPTNALNPTLHTV